ncbi:MAG: RusA family crossover junction endodeoxyribonuclease [Methylorubrum rhodinum]|uniref:RusA family crossover junction endodeoxyribonuclease n=1 Tax=Methylorubrum rhodinum TaxID=29428 RepID=UPI003BAFE6AE
MSEDSTPSLIALRLPFPPGLNNLFKNVARGRARTARYDAWIAEASLALRRQRPAAITGGFKVDFVFDRPDRRRRDLDGLAKAILDLLGKSGVIVDDHLAEDIRLRWSGMPPQKPGGVLVLLEPAA